MNCEVDHWWVGWWPCLCGLSAAGCVGGGFGWIRWLGAGHEGRLVLVISGLEEKEGKDMANFSPYVVGADFDHEEAARKLKKANESNDQVNAYKSRKQEMSDRDKNALLRPGRY